VPEEGEIPQKKVVEEKKEVEPVQESRIRLWLRKPTPPGAVVTAASPSPVPALPSGAVSSASAATDSKEPGSSSSPMDVEECTALVAISAVSDVTSTTTTTTQPSSSSSVLSSIYSPTPYKPPTFESEWKQNYTLQAPRADSLDEEENARRTLDPAAPGVRTTPLPPVALPDDGWRLLSEDELSASLESLELPPVNDLLVEELTWGVVSRDAEGVDELGSIWPRRAFHPIKAEKDFDVGEMIDCKDTVNVWLTAEIKAVRPSGVFVH
jgi:hypothetical protein